MNNLTADRCFSYTIADCLAGDYIVGDRDNSYEEMYYQTDILDPLSRIITNEHRPLNIVVAVARFVWLLAANNRVEDIAFYEPKVRSFSDDGITVPGSDYGLRLFQPRPGLDQIQGVIDRIKQSPGTRQAAAVVWQSEDAVRKSGDIPCTFGMFFHVRRDRLDMCVNMRSNNAFRILPFNLFEFTMLHELVATEAKVPLGKYVHWAASMHVYDNAREIEPTRAIGLGKPANSIRMPSMASWSLTQARELCKFEAVLRHVYNQDELDALVESAKLNLTPYWFDLFMVLVHYVCARNSWTTCETVSDYLGPLVYSALDHMIPVKEK